MDEWRRPDEREQSESGGRTVSRRAFFNRARLGVMAVAGVALFGVATSTGSVTADEESGSEKKKKSEPRDKDRELKEKEQEGKAKDKDKKPNKNDENTSNTKKKNKNGDDSKKKKIAQTSASPYAKYVEKGKDRYGCTAFNNQFDAQQVLRLEPKDPNNLDGNRNGIACDGQDAFMDGVAGGLMNSPFDLNVVSRP